jgi:predicted phage tail protein
MSHLVEVKLLGALGQRFGRSYRLAVSSAAEAIRALCLQLDGFQQFVSESEAQGIGYKVISEDPNGLAEEQLRWPISRRLIIAPRLLGSGSAFEKIIVGVALIGLSLIPGIGPAISFGLLSNATAIGLLGGALILGGISQALTPTPRVERFSAGADRQRSFLFDANNLNSVQGEPVPVLYGQRLIAGAPIVSFALEVANEL